MQAAQNASNANLQTRKTIAANQIDLNMGDFGEGLDSPKEKNFGGDSDDMQSDNVPMIGSQNRQRNISKPNKGKRGQENDKVPGNVQRTP